MAESGFDFQLEKIIILFFTTSRPPLGPTQPPIQWVPELFPPEQSGRGVKLASHLHILSRLRMVGLYLHSPIRLHDMVKR
jgi:hypothetical protein